MSHLPLFAPLCDPRFSFPIRTGKTVNQKIIERLDLLIISYGSRGRLLVVPPFFLGGAQEARVARVVERLNNHAPQYLYSDLVARSHGLLLFNKRAHANWLTGSRRRRCH
jgi:hypothetical protein